MKKIIVALICIAACCTLYAQDTLQATPTPDTIARPLPVVKADTPLRIINLNPYFTIHVDSVVNYQFKTNKDSGSYFWYLRNAPVGVRINKDNGTLYFKADRAYFLSGRLKYDQNYQVQMGVQNVHDPRDKTDTAFTMVFFSTEIIPSTIKPTVSGNVLVDEGQTLSFRVFCETGSFPIESIITSTSAPIGSFKPVNQCGDEFSWTPDYDFVKETDSGRVKILQVRFIGSTRFKMQDSVTVRLVVRNAVNYPVAMEQYKLLVHDINAYILKLKFTFLTLDKFIKKTKRTRTAFDLTAASSALTGTVLATSKNESTKRTGLVLPSVGLVITPLKEATAPQKTAEQNQATLLRSSIKRLEYIVQDNAVIGDKDPELVQKINKLKEEYKQSQLQLIDVPIEVTNNLTEEELNEYFNSMKVKKSYRLKK